MRRPATTHGVRGLVAIALLTSVFCELGCATVPKNRRRYLADPTMPGNERKLEKRATRKFHTVREGAAGGDGKPAGGGCGCTN